MNVVSAVSGNNNIIIGVLYNLLSGELNLDTVIDRPRRVFPTTAVRFPESGWLTIPPV